MPTCYDACMCVWEYVWLHLCLEHTIATSARTSPITWRRSVELTQVCHAQMSRRGWATCYRCQPCLPLSSSTRDCSPMNRGSGRMETIGLCMEETYSHSQRYLSQHRHTRTLSSYALTFTNHMHSQSMRQDDKSGGKCN